MRSDDYKVKGDEKLKVIMEEWIQDSYNGRYCSGADGVVAYHAEGDVLHLCANRPGFFIGYHGTIIDKFKKKLAEIGYTKINLVDMSCGGLKEF